MRADEVLSRRRYDDDVRALQEAYTALPPGAPVRLGKRTSNLFRSRTGSAGPRLDVSAFDGVAAIKEIAAHNPSLILMDVNMPRLDGYQLCKLVKKHETTREIPVLMLTGKDGMFDRLRGRLVGCVGSIAKPFSPEELLEVVEQNILQVRS